MRYRIQESDARAICKVGTAGAHDALCAAGRCVVEQGRFDDAVARLYRAIEALAQFRLAAEYSVPDTKAVALQQVPEPLRSEWMSCARDGVLMLGLQDAYSLLGAYADELATVFQAVGFDDRKKSPLASRNQSILAHGFQPVGEKTYRRIWDGAMQLAGQLEIFAASLPIFPQIGPRRD